MIICIDIGNSITTVGCVSEEEIIFSEKITTELLNTELLYAISFKTIFEIHNIDISEITGGIISSVVPSLTNTIKNAVYKIINIKLKTVGPGLKTGLKIAIDNPAQLGSDLVSDAVATTNIYKGPAIIIHFGTATTISVIDKNNSYIGAIIMPGYKTSLDSMTKNTSQLPKISMELPKNLIGKNTTDSMKSGILYGTASSVDGMIYKIKKELNYDLKIIATGEDGNAIIPLCDNKIIFDENLLLKGLYLIYKKNI